MNASPTDHSSLVHVILRTSGERTFALALKAIEEQTSNYTVVKEYPLQAAIVQMFKVAAQKEAPYVLIVDADVILFPGILSIIAEEAMKGIQLYPALYWIEFMVLDKFRGPIPGCRLYINKHTPELLKIFQKEQKEFRSESETIHKAINAPHLISVQNTLRVGSHDFQQYYRDIYRKYQRLLYLDPKLLTATLTQLMRRRSLFPEDDRDFAIAVHAAQIGAETKEMEGLFDARTYPKIESIGMKEKSDLEIYSE